MTSIAVVTGAASGLGRAISAQLIRDGLHVVELDIDAAGLFALIERERNGLSMFEQLAEASRLTEVRTLTWGYLGGYRIIHIYFSQ